MEQLGEMRTMKVEGTNLETTQWYQTGVREKMLYQCPECKDVKIY